ncbi:hypothetical protein ACUWC2_28260, partial [Klebsiella pneumoniae]|uniref:hypothetical protein n=1 Tax=Klebsiella pneumoniae TaxID=573 RepID=UPI00405542AE
SQFAKEGVGIVMSPATYCKLEDWEPISSRIIVADLNLSIGKVTHIQVYAPTENYSAIDKEFFYSELQRTVDRCKAKQRSIILSGDLNGRIGWNHRIGYGTIGKYGGESTKNENGQRLIDFCVDNNLIIGNSFYPHKKVHKITFSSEGRYKLTSKECPCSSACSWSMCVEPGSPDRV